MKAFISALFLISSFSTFAAEDIVVSGEIPTGYRTVKVVSPMFHREL